MIPRFGLLGDGGQADEASDFALPDAPAFRAVAARFLRSERSDLVDIDTTDESLLATPVTAAVGAPGLRRRLVGEWRGVAYHPIIAPSAVISSSAVLGSGVIISPQTVVSTKVILGDHVILNIGASISHDSIVGDFATISPGARIAGGCRIGNGVFIGIGATVSNGVNMADGVVLGAGAVVTEDLLEPGIYVGMPAKKIKHLEDWLYAI